MPTTATLGSTARLYPLAAGATRRSAAQNPALLGLELLLGQDAPGPEVGQPFELARGRRSGGPRRAPMEHPLLVPLTLLVDRLLNELRLPDVLEDLAAPLACGLDDEVARPDHALEDPLVEPHVVQGLERDLHRGLRDPALAVDHAIRGHDEVGGEVSNGVADRPDDEYDDAGHDDRPEQDVVAGVGEAGQREGPRHGDQDRDDDRARQRDRVRAEIEDQLLALDQQSSRERHGRTVSSPPPSSNSSRHAGAALFDVAEADELQAVRGPDQQPPRIVDVDG